MSVEGGIYLVDVSIEMPFLTFHSFLQRMCFFGGHYLAFGSGVC